MENSNHQYHAKFLVAVYPDEAVRCITLQRQPHDIKAIVDTCCTELNTTYDVIISMVRGGKIDELQRLRSSRMHHGIGGPLHGPLSPPLSQSMRFRDLALGPSGTAAPPSPASTTSATAAQLFPPPDTVVVLDAGPRHHTLLAKPSGSSWSFISEDIVYSRFREYVQIEGCGSGFHSQAHACARPSVKHPEAMGFDNTFSTCRRVTLTYRRIPSTKTAEKEFCVVSNLDDIDMLLGNPPEDAQPWIQTNTGSLKTCVSSIP
jgi:hypothetical protein